MPADIEKLTDEIKKIYRLSPAMAGTTIATLLEGELDGLDVRERLEVLDKLKAGFSKAPEECDAARPQHPSETQLIKRLLPLILGGSASSLPPDVLMERLAQSLNTVFDSLNQLIGLINSTLGTPGEGDETIRRIIGTSLSDTTPGATLQEHLSQIKKAFLITQQAFKEAAKGVLGNVLTVLDPKQMEPSQTGLKIGPLKKAESFEIFEEKYSKCRKWYDSGRFMEDLLRQFEKNCQRLFSENRG